MWIRAKAWVSGFGKWAMGLLLLGLVVVIWVGGSVFVQFIFTKQSFNRPFFLTYYNTSLFSLYLLGFAFFKKWRNNPTGRTGHGDGVFVHEVGGTADFDEENVSVTETIEGEGVAMASTFKFDTTDKEVAEELIETSWKDTAIISAVFCPIWFLANYTFNISLSLTSVSSNTIISTSSSFFSLVFGVMVGIESLSFLKFLAIAICIGGVSLVSITDNENKGRQPLMGDILALASAVAYGVYTVYLRKSTDGFVGLFNLVSLWPFILILHYTGAEVFEPPSAITMGYLTANALIGTVLSDLLWCKVVVLTSPLVATMGLSLTIPLALGADAIIDQTKFRWEALLGSALVFSGFLLVNITNPEKEKAFFLSLWKRVKEIFCRTTTTEDQADNRQDHSADTTDILSTAVTNTADSLT